ncbi:Ceramide glucosyltransferase [Sandaracinus amylolyticus]|nr:Ceramide glucosyltransferase [Sandaracinus amylolyticus]
MVEMLPWIVLGCAVFAYGFFGLGAIATLRHTKRRARSIEAERLPAVSLLKPLKGVEESLEENLESFFTQDYGGPIEIVFATAEPDDYALPVARRVAARYPEIDVRFVLSDPDYGLNPKVANLAGALRAAKHDLVLQSDANVRARPDYLRRVVSELVEEDGALLSSMVVGVGERSPGAAMENLQLSAMIAPSTCFALHYFGVTCVIGKSMLFKRSVLAELGGLERVKDVLAEDYLLGRAFEKAGRRVILSTTVAENVNHEVSIDRFMSRHARWLKMRAVIHPPAFVADLFANPVGLGVIATVLSGFDVRFVAALLALVIAKASTDAMLLRRTRGEAMPWKLLACAPLKDVLLLAIWPYAAISRSIEWRGTRLRLGWQTRLRPDDGALAVRVARRLIGRVG